MGFCCVLLFFLFFLKPAFFSQFLRLLPACHAHPVPPRVPLPRPLGLCSPLGTDAEDQSPPVKPVRVFFLLGGCRVCGCCPGTPRAPGGIRRGQRGRGCTVGAFWGEGGHLLGWLSQSRAGNRRVPLPTLRPPAQHLPPSRFPPSRFPSQPLAGQTVPWVGAGRCFPKIRGQEGSCQGAAVPFAAENPPNLPPPGWRTRRHGRHRGTEPSEAVPQPPPVEGNKRLRPPFLRLLGEGTAARPEAPPWPRPLGLGDLQGSWASTIWGPPGLGDLQGSGTSMIWGPLRLRDLHNLGTSRA